MPSVLENWLSPLGNMMDEVHQQVVGKYGTNVDQPPLRSVDDPTPYKAFHDGPEAYSQGPAAYTGGYPLGGGAQMASPTRKR